MLINVTLKPKYGEVGVFEKKMSFIPSWLQDYKCRERIVNFEYGRLFGNDLSNM